MAQQYILIFDPGASTTRGVLFNYDSCSKIEPKVERVYKTSSETKTINNIISETAPDYMLNILDQIPSKQRNNIAAIWTISHGATAIPLNGAGKPVYGGAVYYNQPIFDKHHQAFLDKFGGPEKIFMETGSAEYSVGINAAQQIFYHMQENPKEWAKVRTLIPLSHYMAYVLSGEKATCHTHARNHACFEKIVEAGQGWRWSSIVSELGIQNLFPAFRRPFDAIGRVRRSIADKYGLSRNCLVGSAGHDTSTVSILAPNYANTGTWICNTATGVPVKLVPEMQPIGLVVNADPFGQNLRTIMARLGVTRNEYRSQFKGELPEKIAFKGFDKVTAQLPVAFTDGVGVCNPVKEARIPASISGDELITSISMMSASAEALTVVLTSDDKVPLGTKLSELHGSKYKARDLVIGGVFVEPLADRQNGAFAEIFRQVYPGKVERFAFSEPTSFAAYVMAACALEGVDPRDLGDRLVIPKEDMTYTGDRGQALEALVRWEDAVIKK